MPRPRERVGDREHEQVLPMQGSSPRQPSRQRERGRRQDEDQRPHNTLGCLVLDRDHLCGAACRLVLKRRDAHAEGPSCARPRSRRGSPARAGFRRRSRFSATTNARSSWNRRAKLVTPRPVGSRLVDLEPLPGRCRLLLEPQALSARRFAGCRVHARIRSGVIADACAVHRVGERQRQIKHRQPEHARHLSRAARQAQAVAIARRATRGLAGLEVRARR